MNIFALFRDHVVACVEALGWAAADGGALDFSRVTCEPPRDSAHGDMATNAALVLAKQTRANPRDLAGQLAARLEALDDVTSAQVAGPGFINLRLSEDFWRAQLRSMVVDGDRYGRSQMGAGQKINVEYVSANPTGPMHVGHCRGAVVGDVLANLLSFAGFDVTKEYYINDAGAQIDLLEKSVFLRYRQALGEEIGEIPSGLYPGDYLVPVGEALAAEFGDTLTTREDGASIVRQRALDAMMAMIRDDLAALNVHHDVFYSERFLHEGNGGRIRSAINDLTMKGHVYKGQLPPPKGQVPEDWEDREQTLFRSTAVGDDQDRPLIKSDGSFTYFAGDVAYFVDKFERGFSEMIFVLGADHGGYVKRLEALARAVSDGQAKLTVLLTNLVKVFRDGEPIRMSKRAGNFVALRDVVDEVGKDAVRFMMLYRKNTEPLDFDFARVTEQSKDNPVFYVQYATARCHSVFRQAREAMGEEAAKADVSALHLLTDAGEMGLIAKAAEFARVVEQAAQTHEPHRLAFYLHDLASALHSHWNRGTADDALRFVKVNNPQLTGARLALVEGVLNVLRSGLGVMGVAAPQEMR